MITETEVTKDPKMYFKRVFYFYKNWALLAKTATIEANPKIINNDHFYITQIDLMFKIFDKFHEKCQK